jgi:serine/threonine protein kinase/tetratricopeptide (TPR) repeat protein
MFVVWMSDLARAALDRWVTLAETTPTVIDAPPASAVTLRAMIDRAPKPWPAAHIVDVMVPLCRLLAAVHESGTVHRDLAPSVICADGTTIYLGGWHAAVSIGGRTAVQAPREPGYRAPELARGDAGGGDVAADLFSLGAMLYELVAGRRAFAAETTLELLLATLAHEPTLPRGAPTLTAICQRLLAKSPEHRPRTARKVAEELLASTSESASEGHARPEPKPRESLGRYIILETLGRGGMGSVLLAYDPDLDRRVAIKLLHPSFGAGRDESHARLLREAKAMARVAHPNVVAIYEVDEDPAIERLYVVMEYVPGTNLRDWMSERPRSWHEVRDVFLAAGCGLAAVHDAGVVHRDFKPENVLVGSDGRVRVGDFGIAGVSSHEAEVESDVVIGAPPLDVGLTYRGAVIGTPRYMAPEQHLGRPVDARADQYAFCVALYEALHGKPPFSASTYRELFDAVTTGAATPPNNTRVPARVAAIVARGLARDPAARWPSMTALLDALAANPAARRRIIAAIGVSVLVVGGVAALRLRSQPTSTAELCTGGAERVGTAWSPAARAKLEHTFAANGGAKGAAIATDVSRDLDRYAADLGAMHDEACRATRVRGEQSEALLDRRMGCLDRRLGSLAALVGVLQEADADVVERSREAVSSLPALDGCSDRDALLARVPLPRDPAVVAEVKRIDSVLDRVAALTYAGKYRAAVELGVPSVAEADATVHSPLQARAHQLLAHVYRRSAETDATEREALLAVRYAALAHDASTAGWALLDVAHVARQNKGNCAESMLAARAAEAMWLGAGNELDAAEARQATAWALIDCGRLADARVMAESALATFQRQGEKGAPRINGAQMTLGTVTGALGDYEASYHWHALAREGAIAWAGADDKRTTWYHVNLAGAAAELGKLDEAQRFAEEALAVSHQGFGDNLTTAHALETLGSVVAIRTGPDAAAPHYERALAICRGLGSPALLPTVATGLGAIRVRQHRLDDARALFDEANAALAARPAGVDAASLADGRGELLVAQHRYAEARAQFQRELAILETVSATHPDTGDALTSIAETYAHEGRCADVRAPLEKGADIITRALGTDHYRNWRAAVVRARCALAKGEPDVARVELDRARALLERVGAAALLERLRDFK